MDIQEAVSQFSKAVNTFALHEVSEEFFRAFSQQHRTLQQNMGRVLVNTLYRLAELEGDQYDLRNEDLVMFAKDFAKKFPKGTVGFWYI